MPATRPGPGDAAAGPAAITACWRARIVWCCGEFGRGPKVDWQPPWNGGRNHYGNVFTVLVAGGGFKGGHVVGSSDAKAEEVKDRPVYPVDLLGSIYQLAGIDANAKLPHPMGFEAHVLPAAVGRREVGRAVDGDHVAWHGSCRRASIPERLRHGAAHEQSSWLAVLGLAGLLAMASAAQAQARPYIGFVYPAGGQQGTTFQVKLGGQGSTTSTRCVVTGKGVSAKVVEYLPADWTTRRCTLLREQLKELKRDAETPGAGRPSDAKARSRASRRQPDEATQNLIARIEKRMAEYVNRPACASISSLVVRRGHDRPRRRARPAGAAAGDAARRVEPAGLPRRPGARSRPQADDHRRLPGARQGGAGAAQAAATTRWRQRITVPCTVNGQIASGEVNRYRFEARKGQRLVISAEARQLIPYIADAVPGWFQPVLTLYDADGQGGGLQRRLPLQARSGHLLRGAQGRRVRA